MNFKAIICVLIIIELYNVQVSDAKRSFGITGRRKSSKSSPSVRRGQHGHDDDHAPLPRPPSPSHDSKKNIGWNTNAQQTHHSPSAPVINQPVGPAITQQHHGGLYGANSHGAPPAYNPGFGGPPAYGSNAYNSHSSYGAPPAYNSHSYGNPPAYSPAAMSYNQPHSYGHQQHSYGSPMMSQPMMGQPMMSQPMMAAPMMGVMPAYAGNQNSGRSFGGGLMTNLFAGLAGYQLARAFSGGSSHNNNNYMQQQPQQRDRDIIIIDNRNSDGTASITTVTQNPSGVIQLPAASAQIPSGIVAQNPAAIPQNPEISQQYPPTPIVSDLPQGPSLQDQHIHTSTINPTLDVASSSENPVSEVPQLMPTLNEYNYWGFPQYGVPLYGFNLPSQITDYYTIDTFSEPQAPSR